MQSSNPAISVRNLSKCYKLGTIGRHTLVDECQYLWHKLRGRDPRQHMTKIGHTATEARKVEAEQEGNQEFWALKDVSFDVQPGEVVGIIGRNGAGKSTLLKLLTRITEPTSGEVVLNGRVASLLEVGTGFHPELTGRENVYMNGTILGMKKREIDAKFDEILAFSELEKFIDTPVKRYSSGMYVRLAFAVAAHLQSEVLLVDEVLAVGDAEFQNKCIGKMNDIAQKGRTVLLVSHNMAAVENLCRRVVMLDKGCLRDDGEPAKVIGTYLQRHAGEGRGDYHLSSIAQRGGTGAVRVIRLRVTNDEGETIGELKSGIDSKYELTIRNCSEIRQSVVVGLRFHDSSMRDLFQCRSDIVAPPFDCCPGEHVLLCHLPHLPLQQGTYSLTVGVIANNDLADLLEHVLQFVVGAGDFYGSGRLPNRLKGSFLVDYSWLRK